MDNKKERKTIWARLSTNWKMVLVGIFLFGIVPFVIINGGIRFSNWISHKTGLDINASGLLNQDWFSFWGAYVSGIATVIAVWWTVYQTERHYRQTSKEQERQNNRFAEEREHQRRLDVLPVVLLQPRIVYQSSDMALLLGEIEAKKEDKKVYVDELKPVYEEIDATEVTVRFASKLTLQPEGLSEEDMRRVRNKGHEEYSIGKGTPSSVVFLRPFWFVNAGKEVAININIHLKKEGDFEFKHLPHVFSLMAKERIKLNFLVDVKPEQINSICGNYELDIWYQDIYKNFYNQIHRINILKGDDYGGVLWQMSLDVEQVLKKETK